MRDVWGDSDRFRIAGLFGFEHQALGDRLWEYGQAELADARLLVEKIVAPEGEPTTEIAPLSWTGDPAAAVNWLIETEAIEALQAGIEPTGREGRSEALEYLIMRKQNQIDFLLRARRTSQRRASPVSSSGLTSGLHPRTQPPV